MAILVLEFSRERYKIKKVFVSLSWKLHNQYCHNGHVTTLKYVLYKIAFSVCPDSLHEVICLVRSISLDRDERSVKSQVIHRLKLFLTLGPLQPIPLLDHSMVRLEKQFESLNEFFVYSQSKYNFFKLQVHFCHYHYMVIQWRD